MTASLPPGPRWPIAFTSLGWATRPRPMLERLRRRYGDTFTIRLAGEGPWVMVSHPDAVREVFTGDPKLLHAGEGNEILGPILGESSVLLLDDEPHLRQRRLLLPPFHGERLARYRDLMREVAERELARWPAGTAVPTRPHMQDVTLEIILRTVFGLRERGSLERLRDPLARMLELIGNPLTTLVVLAMGGRRMIRGGPVQRAMDRVDRLLLEEIHARRAEEDLETRDDVLSLLLLARDEDGQPMTDRELRDELLTLLVAGHETTATALAWALERLVHQPGALERIAAEADVGEDAFTDAVCKETLRLRPVIPIVLRKLVAPMRIAGWDLPAGVKVSPAIMLVHTREDVYPEPFRFRPERFLEQPAGTYTWIPFGGGVRRCLGASFALMEMRIVLQAVATSKRLRAARAEPERIVRRAITLAPRYGGEVVPA